MYQGGSNRDPRFFQFATTFDARGSWDKRFFRHTLRCKVTCGKNLILDWHARARLGSSLPKSRRAVSPRKPLKVAQQELRPPTPRRAASPSRARVLSLRHGSGGVSCLRHGGGGEFFGSAMGRGAEFFWLRHGARSGVFLAPPWGAERSFFGSAMGRGAEFFWLRDGAWSEFFCYHTKKVARGAGREKSPPHPRPLSRKWRGERELGEAAAAVGFFRSRPPDLWRPTFLASTPKKSFFSALKKPKKSGKRVPPGAVWSGAEENCRGLDLGGGGRKKCTRRDSNPQPSVPKTDALSIELRVRVGLNVIQLIPPRNCRPRSVACAV